MATPFTLTKSLANDPRSELEPWLEAVEKQARNLCPQHDITGALSLVVPDEVWKLVPGNITNPAEVAAGTHPAVYRARPNWDMPVQHANNATAAVVSIYKAEAARFTDFSLASSSLSNALLASIGDTNETYLKTVFPAQRTYMLTPREIVDTMTAKHGVATSDDISKLREPLHRALTSLSDLTGHMDRFLLASQRLTRSGQGEKDYRYFELFLESVSSFPSVALCLPGYYLQCPAILQQSLATIFPYLEKLRDHLIRSDPASPFSGSARGGNPANGSSKGKNKKGNKPKQQQPQRQPSIYPLYLPPPQRTQRARWSPQGPVAFSASSDIVNTPPDYPTHISEMQEIRAMLAAMTTSPMQGLYNGMPVPPDQHPHTSLLSSTPPREFYCWLHGWNNTHHGCTCNVMGANQAYTPAMRSARGPDGTGGNPKIGVPVHYSRPPSRPHNLFHPCTPCLPLPLPTFSPPCPPLSPVTSVKINAAQPYEDNREHVLHTLPLDRSEGKRASRVREMACLHLPRSSSTFLPPPIVPPIPTPILTPHPHCHSPHRRRPTHPLPPQSASPPTISPPSASVSWSSPLVTLSTTIPPRPLYLKQDKIRQAKHQRLIKTQDRTRPQPKPKTLNLTPDPSRFAHPNPFQALSYDPFPPDPSHPSLFPSPFSLDLSHLDPPPAPVKPPPPSQAPPQASPPQALSSVITPPLIADTGCTGLLLQFSNFPSLSPFFSHKPLPILPFTLPDRSILSVGGPSHLTGELSFPLKTSPISCYFLPDTALSHSLVGISPLLRPNGHAIFTPTSVSIYDTPTSPLPFLTGSKTSSSDLWFFSVPPLTPPPHPPKLVSSHSTLFLSLALSLTGIAVLALPPSRLSSEPSPVGTSTGSLNLPPP